MLFKVHTILCERKSNVNWFLIFFSLKLIHKISKKQYTKKQKTSWNRNITVVMMFFSHFPRNSTKTIQYEAKTFHKIRSEEPIWQRLSREIFHPWLTLSCQVVSWAFGSPVTPFLRKWNVVVMKRVKKRTTSVKCWFQGHLRFCCYRFSSTICHILNTITNWQITALKESL